MEETWKNVVGYEGVYSISNLGRVRRDKSGSGLCKAGRTLKPILHKSGYLIVNLYRNGICKTHLIANLMAYTFIGTRSKGMQINHKDTNKLNNYLSNLEYVTPKENTAHAFKNGLRHPFPGEKNGQSKLTEKDVLKIRELFAKGNITQRKLAEMFNFRQGSISTIINRKRWKHV